jgi:hypothetical protein
MTLSRSVLGAAACAMVAACGLISGLDSLSVEDASTFDGSTSSDTAASDVVVSDGQQDASSSDADSDCKTAKTPVTDDSGPFCPYQGDGSTSGNCATGQQCCEYVDAGTPSTCQSFQIPCGVNVLEDFECDETNDCPPTSTAECCLTGTVQLTPGCSYYEGKNVTGTTCVTGQQPCVTQICGSSADCPGGHVCTPLDVRGIWLGFCK